MTHIQTEVPGFYRDTRTGIVTNKNKTAFDQIKAQRARDRELLNLRKEIDILKSQIVELTKLVNDIKGI